MFSSIYLEKHILPLTSEPSTHFLTSKCIKLEFYLLLA